MMTCQSLSRQRRKSIPMKSKQNRNARGVLPGVSKTYQGKGTHQGLDVYARRGAQGTPHVNAKEKQLGRAQGYQDTRGNGTGAAESQVCTEAMSWADVSCLQNELTKDKTKRNTSSQTIVTVGTRRQCPPGKLRKQN